MIKKADEMVRQLRENMRGGNGVVEFVHVFSENEMTEKVRLFAKLTLPVGASIGLHDHVNEEEVYYILQGSALLEDNGLKTPISAGDAVLTGNGGCHAIENNGTEPLVFMAVIVLY